MATDTVRPRSGTRTPVTILTGFLGSGKTTLLNRAMRDPAMSRTLVIINEFGEIPLDHALVAASDDTILVLENGCLCCTVFGDLVGTLNRAYHQREAGDIPPFDHVLIETSGLADPGPVLQAFLSEPTLDGLFRIALVIATIDAVNAPGTLVKYTESARQVALADVLLLTKTDLLPVESAGEATAALHAAIRRLNPNAPIVSVSPDVDVSVLMLTVGPDPTAGGTETDHWLDAATSAVRPADCDHSPADSTHGHAHEHAPSVAVFCYVRDDPIPREALSLLLAALERNLGPGLLRVKGLVNVLEEAGQPAVIQGAQHLLHNLVWLERWPTEDERTRIVFIVDTMPREDVEEMIALMDRVAMRTARARLEQSRQSS
ncbi:MAG: CobW family GTP-binding protein [Janthinobacterium lividum]